MQQAKDRLAAGEQWEDKGIVFATNVGTAMNAANVRATFAGRWAWCLGRLDSEGAAPFVRLAAL